MLIDTPAGVFFAQIFAGNFSIIGNDFPMLLHKIIFCKIMQEVAGMDNFRRRQQADYAKKGV